MVAKLNRVLMHQLHIASVVARLRRLRQTVIGPKLKARSFESQKTEARVGVRILNRMTELSRPNFERTA
jgi:hypothetical protein